MSNGEQGADSKEPERHTYTHPQQITLAHSRTHTHCTVALYGFFLPVLWVSLAQTEYPHKSYHKQTEKIVIQFTHTASKYFI